jgi:WhiB family transcriptional regulator, redox-sensing transcriptional regulator
MQWPGTSSVLERRADEISGDMLAGPELSPTGLTSPELSPTGLTGQALGAAEFSSQVYATAELPCRDDPELFFAESPDDVEFAKSLCRSCAVRTACLAGAIARAEPWGVWGGELFLRGEIVPRKRPRGRPRKDAVAA